MRIVASSLISSVGIGKTAHVDALKSGKTGLSDQTEFHQHTGSLNTFLGEVEGVDSISLDDGMKEFECRNNRLAMMALNSDGFADKVKMYREGYGAARIGLVVGTSTSGIAETESEFVKPDDTYDYRYCHTQQMDSLARFSSSFLGICGPSYVVSTACSSSAKVFAVAKRWLDADVVDAVVVGGVDTLCFTTLHGFNSLGLVSEKICMPLDQERSGINIGEAGGFMLLSNKLLKSDVGCKAPNVSVVGVGESSDAFHISTPHPNGEGALNAMNAALLQAGISIDEVQYINLHGTATPSNDLSEISAVSSILKNKSQITYLSSTKGFTGHTLGAAGITEAIFCQLALEENMVIANLNLSELDRDLVDRFDEATLYEIPTNTKILPTQGFEFAMTNSFGFGGNNASVILKKEI